MLRYLFFLALIFSAQVFAAEVKVTSFSYVEIGPNSNNPVAELCGEVIGVTNAPTFIRVLVDAGARRPGTYNTLAGEDGKFCLTLVTYRGRADLSIIGGNQITQAFAK
jgi:hypothetical protein